tara:strand:- start:1961 stop:2239 length:279 start_codon:yes stop_codon:yes gene_type:complete
MWTSAYTVTEYNTLIRPDDATSDVENLDTIHIAAPELEMLTLLDETAYACEMFIALTDDAEDDGEWDVNAVQLQLRIVKQLCTAALYKINST